MAEEFDEDVASAPSGGTGSANPAALDAALAGPSAATEEAREFLRRQTVLTDLQSRILHEQHAFELSHLRWRRFNDQMKGALQIMIVALGLLILVGVAAAVWDAGQADGIVVDTFSVPVQFAQAGMPGDVIADDLTNRVAAVRDFANTHSIARSKGVRNGRAEEIKVEIPDTGVSFAEVSRYLRAWLGHERHLSGNVRVTDDKKIALTVVLDGAGATTFVGKFGDFERLEQLAAEHVFQNVDPSNYVLYLYGKRRPADAATAVQYLIQVADSPAMLSDGYALWSNWTRNYAGDLLLSLKRARIAADTDPKAAPPHLELMGDYLGMGREEDALREARQIPGLKQEEQYAWREGPGFGLVVKIARQEIHLAAADFKDAETDGCGLCSRPETLLGQAEYAAREHDIARSHALISTASAMDSVDPALVNRAGYFGDAASGDWQSAISAAQRYAATATARNPRLQHIEMLTAITPLLAVALAHTGVFGHAHTEIDLTPGDCVICETARGEIDGLEGNIAGAAWWFARADRDAPSIPFADADWGAILLSKGDYDGAMAKFSAAHKKGPRFADPLEMWGEALMQANRSDLALAKFEEANKHAPNWGRLHLKWGEALFWSGDKAAAQKQFDVASGLELGPQERIELSGMKGTHG